MKHLLIVGGLASALCLGFVAAHADIKPPTNRVPSTRAEDGGRLAQFATLCRQNCQQTYAACHNKNANDPSCADNYNKCIQECR